MIKFGSYSTTIVIPFEIFQNEFSTELHYKLRDINKKWFNSATIEKNTYNYIRIWERKALHCNYYPDINGNTVVEYSAEMTVFSLIIWIISIILIVGIIYFPFYFFGNRIAASQCSKKINKTGPSVVNTILKNLEINKNQLGVNYQKDLESEKKSNLLPPPIKKNDKPPPIPKINNDKNYYIILNDEQIGPLNLEKIELLIKVKQITSSTLIWESSMKDWTKAIEIEQVNLLLNK